MFLKKIVFVLVLIIHQNILFSQPSASFTVSPAVACVGDTITMTSTSSGPNPIVNYYWSAQGAIVESGNGSNLTSFKFVYAYADTFNLSLVVQDSEQLAGTVLMEDVLIIHPNPTATIVSQIVSCTLPFELNFANTGSTTGATILSTWQLIGASPASSNASQVLATYNAEGNYTAKLTITNNQTGCKAVAIKNFTLENFVADFVVPTSVCKGDTINLTNASSASATSYSWTTASGIINNTSSPNPFLIYNTAGNQTITLTASNAAGCSDSETKTVVVNDLPQVSFTHDDNFGCAPKNVSFTNTSSNSINTYTWNFDDGSPIFTGFNPPPHTYLSNNTLFFPSLSVVDINGCTNIFTTSDTIYLFPPEAHFSATPFTGCAPALVQFTNQSYSHEPIVSYQWDFDDGTTSTLQIPTHTFTCGEFDVRLIIVNQNGCTDTTYISDQRFNLFDNTTNVGTTVPDIINIVTSHPLQTIVRAQINTPNNDIDQYVIEFGALVNSDISVEDSVLCSLQELVVNATTSSVCPSQEDLIFIWMFEGFGEEVTYVPTITKIFNDTLNFNNPMDISLVIEYNGCVSPINIQANMVYLKGPVAAFNLPNPNVCNSTQLPVNIPITDLASVYGHTNTITFNNEEVVQSQQLDDVDVFYDWGDGTNTIITNDNELEDTDKGASTHNYANYGTYEIMQIITNHTTQCSDTISREVTISFVNASVLTDSVCLFQDYQIQVEANSSHFPLSYTISNQLDTYSSNNSADTLITLPNATQYLTANTPGNELLTLTVTNDVGCSTISTKSLVTLDLPIAEIFVAEDTVCKNSFVSLNPQNSTLGMMPNWLSSLWFVNSNVANITTNNLDELILLVDTTLTIRLQVVDEFGCVSNNSENIIIYPQVIEASFVTNEYLCNDVSELLDASESNGVGDLTYTWYLDNNLISQTNNDSLFHTIHVVPENLLQSQSTYSLVVTDSKFCKDSISLDVLVSNPRISNVDTSIFSTSVDNSGNLTCPPVVVDFSLEYETNFTASNYHWSFSNDFDEDFDSYNETPVGIQYFQAGSYDLLVQMTESVTGCVFKFEQEAFLVIGGPKAEVLIEPDPKDKCGLSYVFQVINPSENLDRWDWNLGDGTIEQSENHLTNSFIHTYLNQEDFNPVITIYDDSLQCAIPITVKFDMIENGLNAYFTMNPPEAVVDLNLEFVDTSTSSNAPIASWSWDYGDGSNELNYSSANVYHTYLDQDAQNVVLTITDTNGCTDQYTLPIDLFLVNFQLPNIITNPTGSGANSQFTLFTDIFTDYHLVIVNRWGSVVHDGKKDPQNPLLLWNGLDHLTNKVCVDGTYFFILEGELKSGKQVKFQDYLTLVNGK